MYVVEIVNHRDIAVRYGYGHAAGVSLELEKQLDTIRRERDLLFRLSESTLVLILFGTRKLGQIRLAASRLTRTFEKLSNADTKIAVGCAGAGGDRVSPVRLLSAADEALSEAALNSARCAVRYGDSLVAKTSVQLMPSHVAHAIEQDELKVWYQPQIDSQTGAVDGAEALLRWPNCPMSAGPEDIVDAAKRGNLIDKLTRAVLNRAIQDWVSWKKLGLDLSLSVNVDPAVLTHPNFANDVSDSLAIWNMPASRLVVEVTENGFNTDDKATYANFEALQELGTGISIDDFGTGTSSLSQFESVPANEVKIDKSFILTLDQERTKRRMVKAIIHLAHSFGKAVVAEGVENEASRQLLVDMGCDQLQGFFFSRPVPVAEFLEFAMRDTEHASTG